jgi:hypothetical protein
VREGISPCLDMLCEVPHCGGDVVILECLKEGGIDGASAGVVRDAANALLRERVADEFRRHCVCGL